MGCRGAGGLWLGTVHRSGVGKLVYSAGGLGGGRAHFYFRLALSLAQSRDLLAGFVRVKLWIAQGFGIGRISRAPGTFGSVLGVLWFAILLAAGNLWVLVGGAAAGAALSVWLCGVAERILKQQDPGS